MNNAIIDIDRQKYKKIKMGDFSCLDQDEINVLKEQEFVFDEDKDKQLSANIFNDMYNEALLNTDNLHISFYVTDHCNMRCNFCFMLGDLCQSHMSEKTVDEITEFLDNLYKNRKKPIKNIQFQYTGGEPFLNKKALFKLIKNNYYLAKKHKIKFSSSITTNGTQNLTLYDLRFLARYLINIKITFNLFHDDTLKRYSDQQQDENDK